MKHLTGCVLVVLSLLVHLVSNAQKPAQNSTALKSASRAADRKLPIWPLWKDGQGWLGYKQPAGVTLPSPELSIFYPISKEKQKAAVLILPGGAYQRHAAHEGGAVAEYLSTRGFYAAVVNYRVAPYGHPYPLADARRAMRVFKNDLKTIAPEVSAVVVLGFSAGGHLAASVGNLTALATEIDDDMAYISAVPDGVGLIYPVISMVQQAHERSKENLLGKAPDETLLHTYSLEQQVSDSSPPAFIMHTANDPGVSALHALSYAQACQVHNVPYSLHVYPKGKHGLGLAQEHPEVKSWPELFTTWLMNLTSKP